MTVADRQRQGRAEVLADSFNRWIPCTTRQGQTIFGIPSQTQVGVFHLANHQRCDCLDSVHRSGPCKHVRAVRIALVRAGVLPEVAF